MTCQLTTRAKVRTVVLQAVRERFKPGQAIDENTTFWEPGFRVRKKERARLHTGVKKLVTAKGCTLSNKVKRKMFKNAGTIREIVDFVWNDLKPKE